MFSLVIGLLTMTTASDSLITLPTEPQALVREVETEPKAESTETKLIINKIKEVFGKDAEVMTRIAFAESSLRQFKTDGQVVIGKQTHDIGLFQISPQHKQTWEKLGLDPYELEGNIKFAQVLFQESGTKPWDASKNNWQN